MRWARIVRKKWRALTSTGPRAAPVDALDEAAVVAIVRSSPLFDIDWYLGQNEDVARAGAEPALHYVRHGAPEGRDPGPRFSTRYYLGHYPDVAASGLNPLVHYHRVGEGEARATGPQAAIPQPQRLVPGRGGEGLGVADPLHILRLIAGQATPPSRLARVSEAAWSPLISLIVPTYNTPPNFLYGVVQSILAQTWTRWELCLVDDGSTSAETLEALAAIGGWGDARIRIARRDANGGIATASQDALDMAQGEYVGFVDHDDLLTPNALSEVVAVLRDDPSLDYVYTDHANVAADGTPRYYARKPAWSPEFLLATNYIVHFKVVRRDLLRSIGGLRDEIANVQDLGMSCRLAAAGARIRHAPVIAYLWREHDASVASSSAAKPGIEGLLMQVYDRHLAQLGSDGRSCWPNAFQNDRIGAFETVFPPAGDDVAIVALSRGGAADRDTVAARLLDGVPGGAALHVVDLGRDGLSDDALLDHVGTLPERHVVFVDAAARAIGPDWLSGLAGYLSLDPDIVAAGGKALDAYLRVTGGGALIDASGQYRLIAGGEFDSAPGHWFTGQVASNVDALTGPPLAVRRDALVAAGGLRVREHGDAAALMLTRRLRAAGGRLVYNPACKLLDDRALAVPGTVRARALVAEADEIGRRVYEPL